MRIYQLALAALLFVAAIPTAAAASDCSDIGPEEYKVYEAAIAGLIADGRIKSETDSVVKVIVIADRTVRDSGIGIGGSDRPGDLREKFPTILASTLEQFIALRKNECTLPDKFKFELGHVLVSSPVLGAVSEPPEEKWRRFYKRFPGSGGYFGFSRAGFNREMTEAIVYLEHYCGSLCATGRYVLLTKKYGHWQVESVAVVWVS